MIIIPPIHITAEGVVESTIVYGIVHGIWLSFKWALKQLETESGRIIDSHVKDGHHARLKNCVEGGCSKLGIELDSPRQAQ